MKIVIVIVGEHDGHMFIDLLYQYCASGWEDEKRVDVASQWKLDPNKVKDYNQWQTPKNN